MSARVGKGGGVKGSARNFRRIMSRKGAERPEVRRTPARQRKAAKTPGRGENAPHYGKGGNGVFAFRWQKHSGVCVCVCSSLCHTTAAEGGSAQQAARSSRSNKSATNVVAAAVACSLPSTEMAERKKIKKKKTHAQFCWRWPSAQLAQLLLPPVWAKERRRARVKGG